MPDLTSYQKFVLKKAHEILDDMNAVTDEAHCVHCGYKGYDSFYGLAHAETCIILKLRELISDHY